MPTYHCLPEFYRNYEHLSPEEKDLFKGLSGNPRDAGARENRALARTQGVPIFGNIGATEDAAGARFAAASGARGLSGQALKRAVKKFREDLTNGRRFRRGLRVKGITTRPGVFEMTWADNGRAAFSYGDPIHEGEAHIIWHAVGGHEIF